MTRPWLAVWLLAGLVARVGWSQETTDAELDALRQAAESTAGQTEEIELPATGPLTTASTGGPSALQALNPEISFIGDLVGSINDNDGPFDRESLFSLGRDRFSLRVLEVSLQSWLDPYTRAKVFLETQEGLEIDEAYLEYTNIGGGWALKAGQFRPQFGVLNRWHEHAQPQVDTPRALAWLFEEGRLSQLGLGLSRLVGPWWADVNEVELTILNGGDEVSLAGEDFDRPAFTAHLKSFYELSPTSYLEWGIGGLYGWNDPDGNHTTRMLNLNVSYDRAPPGRGKYRGFTARGELFWTQREQDGLIAAYDEAEGGVRPSTAVLTENVVTSIGLYAYLESKLDRRWSWGLRYDYAQLPDRRQDREWGFSPVLTYQQSEMVRWRLQLSHYDRNFAPDENVLFLQLDFGAGPHRHEAY